MDSHDIPTHDNLGMAFLSLAISVIGALFTQSVTGEVLHFASIIFGAILVFFTQKLMHYLWDKYITKK